MPATTSTSDALRAFFERRYPGYHEMVGHWVFLEDAYRGGRSWFFGNIFKYFKEGDEEFQKRLDRAYRFNHTREVVELVLKYLFKGEITRNETAAKDFVRAFWKNATLNGLDVSQLVRSGAVGNSIGGRVAIVVDNNYVEPVTAAGKKRKVSKAEAKKRNFKIYAYVVPTKDILDYAFDEEGDGGLLWIKLRENVRDDKDPINSTGIVESRVRLWDREGWRLYKEVEVTQSSGAALGGSTPEKQVELIESGFHNLGEVPVELFDHTIADNDYIVPGLIDDIAYLDRAVANYLSNLDAIIQDQTFSQLAIPAQALQQGDDLYTKVLELGTKRVFVYDAGTGSSAKPEYLSPDPKQAGVILSVINKIINEIYHTIGLAGERTKEDNAVGIDNSSGVAKAYDFERVNSLLLSKAKSCETLENKMVRLVHLWAGEEPPEEALVTYPITFDVMRLVDDLVTAEGLGKLMAPPELRRHQMRGMIDKLFPQLAVDIRKKIEADIETWLDEPDLVLAPPTATGAKPAAAANRQGSVTKDTPAKKPAK